MEFPKIKFKQYFI